MDKTLVIEFAKGTIRHLLTTFGGGLLTAGYLVQGDVETLSGAVAIIIGLGWSLYEKKSK
jgi:hypothetical protein